MYIAIIIFVVVLLLLIFKKKENGETMIGKIIKKTGDWIKYKKETEPK